LISSFGGIVYKTIKVYKGKKRLNQAVMDIPYLTRAEIHRSMKYFVNTKCQSVSPSITSEPGHSFAFVPRELIIPFFIKKVFNYFDNDSKYFLILADSGMGKTTFLINLLIKFRQNQLRLFNWITFQTNDVKIKY